MLVEIQHTDFDQSDCEAINLMSVFGVHFDTSLNEDSFDISVYFAPVLNPAAPSGYVYPSTILGTYTEYEDAMKVYTSLMKLNWMFPGYVKMPEKDGNIEGLLIDWSKYFISAVGN